MSEDDFFFHFALSNEKNQANQSFSLLNLQGRSMYSGHICDGYIQIEKNLMSNGVYFLQIHGLNNRILPFTLSR